MKVRCPHCRKTFPWDASLPLPSKCPLPGCDYVAAERDDNVIVIAAPFIGSARTKATDACYRELETSSAARAEAAAHMAGVPVSEMSHLKVTNLKDNTREGEVAAMPVVNAVTRQMDMLKARGMPTGFGGAADTTSTATGAITVNGQVIQNIEPRAGSRAMSAIQARLGR